MHGEGNGQEKREGRNGGKREKGLEEGKCVVPHSQDPCVTIRAPAPSDFDSSCRIPAAICRPSGPAPVPVPFFLGSLAMDEPSGGEYHIKAAALVQSPPKARHASWPSWSMTALAGGGRSS